MTPTRSIACTVISRARSTSSRRSGQTPRVGSAPRKKFRQIESSGATARSCQTVAMPAARACCGERKCTGSPPSSSCPSSCRRRPDSTATSVDFPEPFSPSTQVICPAGRVALTRDSACDAAVPDAQPRSSSSGTGAAARPVREVTTGAPPSAGGAPRRWRAGPPAAARPSNAWNHGGSQPAQRDALPGDGVDQRADRGADRRAVAAGEQAAADDGDDDEVDRAGQAGGPTCTPPSRTSRGCRSASRPRRSGRTG